MTDDDPSVMAIKARQQVNQIAAATKTKQPTAELNQLALMALHLLIPHLRDKSFIIIVTSVEKDTMQENVYNALQTDFK